MDTQEINRIASLADKCRNEYLTRDNARGVLSMDLDKAPDWFQGMVHGAHDGKLPNDWSYRFIEDALEELAEIYGRRIDDEVEIIDAMREGIALRYDTIDRGDMLSYLEHMERWERVNENMTNEIPSTLEEAISYCIEDEAREVAEYIFYKLMHTA